VARDSKTVTPPLTKVRWEPTYRIIPSRYPPVELFARVADRADLDAVFAVEALTSAQLREESGEIQLIAPEDRVAGPGSRWIMAPFTYVSSPGGRFSTEEFGAYYTARALATAIAETKYHRARFLRATSEPPMVIDMRVLRARLSAELHDLRGLREAHPALYHPTDYSASQAFARTLRAERSWGVVYESVRHEGGECAAVLRPAALSNCKQAQHLGYVWDGSSITSVFEKRMI